MSKTQIVHIDGERKLTNEAIKISNGDKQDCCWEIRTLGNGSLEIRRDGRFAFDVSPISPGIIQCVRKPPQIR